MNSVFVPFNKTFALRSNSRCGIDAAILRLFVTGDSYSTRTESISSLISSGTPPSIFSNARAILVATGFITAPAAGVRPHWNTKKTSTCRYSGDAGWGGASVVMLSAIAVAAAPSSSDKARSAKSTRPYRYCRWHWPLIEADGT